MPYVRALAMDIGLTSGRSRHRTWPVVPEIEVTLPVRGGVSELCLVFERVAVTGERLLHRLGGFELFELL